MSRPRKLLIVCSAPVDARWQPRRRTGAPPVVPPDAGEQDGHGLARRTRPLRVSDRRPARPAVPVWSASIPVDARASSFASWIVASSTTIAAPPVRSHRLDDRQPVVGLVVEDPVRHAVAAPSPRPHVRGTGAPGRARAPPGDAGGHGTLAGPGPTLARAGRSPLPGPRRASAPRSRIPSARASSNAAATADARAPPPTWTTTGRAARCRPGGRPGGCSHAPRAQPGDHLVAERLAALDGEAVLGALAGERDGTGGDGIAEPAVRSDRPSRPARASTGDDVGAELAQPGDHHRVRVGRDEDVEGAAGRPRHDGRRQRGVAAARDRERPVARRPCSSSSATSRSIMTPTRWRALCEPETFAVSSLTSRPAVRQPEPRRERRCRLERGLAEPATVDRGDGVVEVPDEVRRTARRTSRRRGRRARRGRACGSERRSAHRRTGGRDRRRRKREPGRVDGAAQDVVDVVPVPGGRAAGDERDVVRHGVPTAGAAQPDRTDGFGDRGGAPPGRARAARPRHDATGTPTRALNSSISPSQTGRIVRVSVQNAGPRRASNSSIGTPCCSTHV